MNEKTAKLLRKYSKATDANLNDLKRTWNDMVATERRDFRVQMKDTVANWTPPVEEPAAEEAPAEETA